MSVVVERRRRNRGLGLGMIALLLAVIAGMPAQAARRMVDATGTTVTLPAHPERVAALGERDLDAAFALGIVPVGRLDGRGAGRAPRYLGPRADQVPRLGRFLQPSMGRLIDTSPDLILAGGFTDTRVIAQLRRIAPTVVTYNHEDDWKTSFSREAEALGRRHAGQRFMARYRARVRHLRDALGDHGRDTVSIVRWNPRGPMTMDVNAFASRVLRAVGLRRPPSQRQSGIAHTPPLSLEALDRLEADWLFIGTLTATPTEALVQARASPAFRDLQVNRRGHAFGVDGALWTSRGGPLAAMAILDRVAHTIGQAQ